LFMISASIPGASLLVTISPAGIMHLRGIKNAPGGAGNESRQ
jgi:hypothetical protein